MMRILAARIERATRNYFLEHEEEVSDVGTEAFQDRQEIQIRINELKEQGNGFWAARKLAVEEWIENLLMENCFKS